MKLISEYYSEDESKTARVYIDDERPVVEFREGDQVKEVRSFDNHTLRYAEDAAENYVTGVLVLTH